MPQSTMLEDQRFGRVHTAPLARTGKPTKALFVLNHRATPFGGVAVLRADFRTRMVLPVAVFAPSGEEVPSRLVDEVIGHVGDDGKRRWAFALEFFCDCPPQSVVAYAAVFTEPAQQHADWDSRKAHGVEDAIEYDCTPGTLPNPCALERMAE